MKSPAALVEQLTRVSVGCPQRGQNCFDISRVIWKQPWQRSTQVLTRVMRANAGETRFRFIRSETFCIA